MIRFRELEHIRLLQIILLLGICAEVSLFAYGWATAPGIKLLSILTVALISLIHLIAAIMLFPKIYNMSNKIISIAVIFGFIAGVIFTCEIVLEYIMLPKDNSVMGLIEYGGVFILFFVSSLVFSWRYNSFRRAILTALCSSYISSIIWVIVTLSVFYFFRGTALQKSVFNAEENYDDFIRSGMSNFNTFIVEDFFGAAFFHSLLLPFLAGLLGIIAGSIGKLYNKIRKTWYK